MKFRSLIIKTEQDDVKRFGLKVYTSLVSSIEGGNKNDSFAVDQQTFPSSSFLLFARCRISSIPPRNSPPTLSFEFKFDMKFPRHKFRGNFSGQERASLHVNVLTEFPRGINSYSPLSHSIYFFLFSLFHLMRTLANESKRRHNDYLFMEKYKISRGISNEIRKIRRKEKIQRTEIQTNAHRLLKKY